MFLWRSSPFMCLPIDIRWNERTNHQKLVDTKQKASNPSLKISCNSHLQPTKSEKNFTVLTISAPKKPQPQTKTINQPIKTCHIFPENIHGDICFPNLCCPVRIATLAVDSGQLVTINILKWFFAFFQQGTNC